MSDTEANARHRLAGWLLRLPHVVSRYGRAAARRWPNKPIWSTARWWTARIFPNWWTSRWWKARSRTRTIWRKSRRFGRTRSILVSLGDCAVTSNIPGMRNPFRREGRARPRLCRYRRRSRSPFPSSVIPRLLDRVRPVHEVVPVDVFVPGCPPSADMIFQTFVGPDCRPDAAASSGHQRFGA